MKKKMNRRGAMEIILLVLLVGMIVAITLFTFGVNPPYLKVNVHDARFVENVYQKQDLAEFYIKQVGKVAIEREIGEDFGEKFKEEFNKYNFEEDYLIELQKIISEDKIKIFTNAETLEIVIDSWETEDSFGKIQIKYTPEISVKFDFKN